jgi:diguanylate cyclase (GGDEF)-like protein
MSGITGRERCCNAQREGATDHSDGIVAQDLRSGADNVLVSSATENPPEQQWIDTERLRLAFSNVPTTMVMSCASAGVFAFIIATAESRVGLAAWFVLTVAIAVARYLVCRRFMALAGGTTPTALWRRRLDIGTAVSGLCWGFGGVYFYPPDLPHQVYLMFVVAGISAAAMTSYAAFRRTYFLFVLPVCVPVVLRNFAEGTQMHYGMAVLIVMYLVVLARSATAIELMIANVLRVRAENAELTKALHHEATHDALVDLFNYREFHARLAALATSSTANRQPYALLFIDLDHFKTINDTAGHAAGDETLRRVGQLIRSQLRSTDTAARMGGDEFAVLLPLCPRERAAQIGANILAAVRNFTLDWEGREFRVGASIGVAFTRAGELDAASVLRGADAACYAAKKNGRNRVEVDEHEVGEELNTVIMPLWNSALDRLRTES